jgi:hypothetical protein
MNPLKNRWKMDAKSNHLRLSKITTQSKSSVRTPQSQLKEVPSINGPSSKESKVAPKTSMGNNQPQDRASAWLNSQSLLKKGSQVLATNYVLTICIIRIERAPGRPVTRLSHRATTRHATRLHSNLQDMANSSTFYLTLGQPLLKTVSSTLIAKPLQGCPLLALKRSLKGTSDAGLGTL